MGSAVPGAQRLEPQAPWPENLSQNGFGVNLQISGGRGDALLWVHDTITVGRNSQTAVGTNPQASGAP